MTRDIPGHYPFVTRMAAALFRDGLLTMVSTLEIEPEYGYVARLRYTNGTTRLIRGSDVGLNPAAACEVARDKAYTKFFLRLSGVSCPKGEAFLTKWWAERMGRGLARHGIDQIRDVDELIGYRRKNLILPVFVKPVDGSKGVNVWRCTTDEEIRDVLERFEKERVKVALIEEEVRLPDFRLVVLDGELISAYRRRPLTVLGDGRSSIAELLDETRREYDRTGRATSLHHEEHRIGTRLSRLGLGPGYVPAPGEEVQLLDVSNLSTGGTAIDHSGAVAGRWRRLAVDIADAFGLRLCGVDLACPDVTSGDGEYSVIEVNASPGLDHFGAVGADQERIVRDLYTRVLNTPPEGR